MKTATATSNSECICDAGARDESGRRDEYTYYDETRGRMVTRPAVGSPYYIDERTGYLVFISPPGTRPVTSEDVRRELEDFP